MSNSLSASFPAYWSRRMQRKFEKVDVYRMIASFEEQGTLKRGNTVHRPYRSTLVVNTLGAEGNYTRQDITDTDESLVINQEKEVSFYVRDIDAMQSNYDTINEYADDAAVKLSNKIDGDVLAEVVNATSTVDDGTIGGTSGNGLTLTTSNIVKVLGAINKKLTAQNAALTGRWAVISPEFYDVLWQFLAGKESALGDKTGENGHVGRYAGLDLYLSNSVYASARLEVGTNPTADDTVTIQGVTFTFKASPAAAGEVDIGGDAATSVDNLVAAINNSNGYAAGAGAANAYYEVTAANRKLLAGITATDGTTYLTLAGKGVGYLVVAETLTAAADIWTTTKQLQHVVAGCGKAVDVVIQKYPNMKTKDRDGYIGKDIVTWTVYGIKTFSEGAKMLVNVKLRSDAY